MSMQEGTKQAMDAVSVVTVIGTLADVLPALAALFTIVWTGIRIWETPTIQGLLNRPKAVSSEHNTDRDGNE